MPFELASGRTACISTMRSVSPKATSTSRNLPSASVRLPLSRSTMKRTPVLLNPARSTCVSPAARRLSRTVPARREIAHHPIERCRDVLHAVFPSGKIRGSFRANPTYLPGRERVVGAATLGGGIPLSCDFLPGAVANRSFITSATFPSPRRRNASRSLRRAQTKSASRIARVWIVILASTERGWTCRRVIPSSPVEFQTLLACPS